MKVIVINGSAGVGKSSFVDCARHGNTIVVEYSTIDIIKTIAQRIGWNGQKDEKGRKFLSDLKDAFTDYNDLPFQTILEQLRDTEKEYKDSSNVVCFIHCREPEEIQRFVDEIGAKTLLIRRAVVPEVNSNHADKNVYDFDYDYVYRNDGDYEQLERESISFVNWIASKPWDCTLKTD